MALSPDHVLLSMEDGPFLQTSFIQRGFKGSVGRVLSLPGRQDPGWVAPSSIVVLMTILCNGPETQHSQQVRGWLSDKQSYISYMLKAYLNGKY